MHVFTAIHEHIVRLLENALTRDFLVSPRVFFTDLQSFCKVDSNFLCLLITEKQVPE